MRPFPFKLNFNKFIPEEILLDPKFLPEGSKKYIWMEDSLMPPKKVIFELVWSTITLSVFISPKPLHEGIFVSAFLQAKNALKLGSLAAWYRHKNDISTSTMIKEFKIFHSSSWFFLSRILRTSFVGYYIEYKIKINMYIDCWLYSLIKIKYHKVKRVSLKRKRPTKLAFPKISWYPNKLYRMRFQKHSWQFLLFLTKNVSHDRKNLSIEVPYIPFPISFTN